MDCQLIVATVVAATPLVALPGIEAGSVEAITRSAGDPGDRPYRFSPRDAKLLDEVQRAAFDYFWQEIRQPACLVRDRKLASVSSVAAVGFQLSAIPIGVSRGWISRQQGERRAQTVLAHLLGRPGNRRDGVFLHFVDPDTAAFSHAGYETVASTVDHGLLVAGAIPAAEFFGGEVARLVDRLIGETNWQAYAVAPHGFLSMGFRPDDGSALAGTGRMVKATWHIASDEERLVYLLAVASPRPSHRLEPALYYRLERTVKRHRGMPPYVVSSTGTLFHYFFSHLWIDYGRLGMDDPRRFGAEAPRVDWFENSRRAVQTHRRRCAEQADRFQTLADGRWGMSACAGRDGYIVPQVRPNLTGTDQWFEGTVAPYAAVSSILFTPSASMAAIRAFRALKDETGQPMVWRAGGPREYGFPDAFNLDQHYVSRDYVGIDQGSMLLAIENARTGMIWRLFMRHATIQQGLKRLGLSD